MLIGLFKPNILSGHFGPEIGSRTFIPILEAMLCWQEINTDSILKIKLYNVGLNGSSLCVFALGALYVKL